MKPSKPMSQFINIFESSLLFDLLHLYSSDLERDEHEHNVDYDQYLTCSKEAIVVAIKRHQEMVSTKMSGQSDVLLLIISPVINRSLLTPDELF